MSNTFFSPIRTWCLPQGALPESLQEMARDGIGGNEGIALWLGHRVQGQAEITHVVGLRGPGVIKRPDFLRIEPWLLNDVTDLAIDLGVVLVGQVHTHGPGYGTDLSVTDRTYGIAVPFYISVVAPDYGLREGISITDCGVHVFEPGLGYRRLTIAEVERQVQIVLGVRPPLLLVGEE